MYKVIICAKKGEVEDTYMPLLRIKGKVRYGDKELVLGYCNETPFATIPIVSGATMLFLGSEEDEIAGLCKGFNNKDNFSLCWDYYSPDNLDEISSDSLLKSTLGVYLEKYPVKSNSKIAWLCLPNAICSFIAEFTNPASEVEVKNVLDFIFKN